MTTTTETVWDTIKTEIERDSYGRPLVYPAPGATKKIAYTRCTTFVDAVEDKYNLNLWSQRMVALGLAARPDYLLAVTTADGDKEKLNALCTQAKEFAQATSAATIGTALHALTERLDRGEELPVLNPPYTADIAAYKEATAPLKILHREAFTVHDKLKVGGTPDGIAEYKGERFIFDVKTGNIEYGIAKIARQLALYSRSALYDHETGKRTPHGASTRRGLIVHLPAATGTCSLVWVDLVKGWHGVQLCTTVREHRTLKSSDLAREGLDAEPFPDLERLNPMPIDNLLSAISGATSRAHLNDIWAKNQGRWSEIHQAAGMARAQWLDLHTPKETTTSKPPFPSLPHTPIHPHRRHLPPSPTMGTDPPLSRVRATTTTDSRRQHRCRVSNTPTRKDPTMAQSVWDNPELKSGGEFHSWKDAPVGTTISGVINSIRAHHWDDGSSSPQLTLTTDDGEEKTLTASQVQIKARLVELRPNVGDHLKVTLTQVEKRGGGKTLKHFDVTVTPGAGQSPATAPAGRQSFDDSPPPF